MPSKEKIALYRKNGFEIGDNVKIGEGSILIGSKIQIGDNVKIGEDTYIESPKIQIGKNTSIGNDCEFVGSVIQIGEFNNISNKVYVDISGGRYPDSVLITGKGCLIADGCYINICRKVDIGENVALSPRSIIYTHSYWQSVLDGYSSTFGPVIIEDNAWLGSMSQILPNIVVKKGSIIISNSLVTNMVKAYSMVGGVPAVLIKENLKNDNNDHEKYIILKRLFTELAEWLYSQNCDVENISDNIIKIRFSDSHRLCMLFEKNTNTIIDDMDIVIYLKPIGNYPSSIKTILNIDEKLITGPKGEIESLILEFFRRKGIRFYEK